MIDLGLETPLKAHAVVPAELRVLHGKSGREIVRMPLADTVAQRYGAPYWMIHRGDLQTVLASAVAQNNNITLKLGTHVDRFVVHPKDVTVFASGPAGGFEQTGLAFLAADGLWSGTRAQLGDREPPQFSGRAAWRALLPAKNVAAEFREPVIRLWLAANAHLVAYPVKGGDVINVVVITDDTWRAHGWSEPAATSDLLARFAALNWTPQALSLMAAADGWLKWALHDRRPQREWSSGPVALLGDAAHPMLPYLAQGAAMAIEDAVVAAQCLARMPDRPAAALRAYTAARRARATKVQRLAARNGRRYHLSGVGAMVRDLGLHVVGGARLLHHYDWLYDWRPPTAIPLD